MLWRIVAVCFVYGLRASDGFHRWAERCINAPMIFFIIENLTSQKTIFGAPNCFTERT
jgi:hypothetical protein